MLLSKQITDIKYICDYYSIKYKIAYEYNTLCLLVPYPNKYYDEFILTAYDYSKLAFNKDKGWDTILGRLHYLFTKR